MSEANLKETKVLIVDDTPANLDVLWKTLEPRGYKVQIAPSGEIALKILEKTPYPDLILLDVMMPGIDGYETCRRMKMDQSICDIPVIFLTAKNQAEDIVQGFEVGGVDYVTKPFRQEEVFARVETHINIRRLKKNLELKNQELKELNDLKNKFIGMAAHDLRNPLATIEGFSGVLLRDAENMSPPDRNQFLNIVNSESSRMLNLVNELLDVSVIESGKLDISAQSGSLKLLVEERIKLFETSANKKNIFLKSNLEKIPDCYFDLNKIGQVLDNLISNSIKYSPLNKNVFITLKQDGNNIAVGVKDEGPGISEEDQAKLFEHFQKLSAKPTAGESSTGLGLAIAKKMVEAHNGSLEVDSVLGQGANFIFTLPLDLQTKN
jgi:two-component system sensor histidine kinase/response regulator